MAWTRPRKAGALPEQVHVADLWLPQKGIFSVGNAVFERLDTDRHQVPTTL